MPIAAQPQESKWALPLAAGGLSALGSIGSSAIAAYSANKQQQFQERMSNSAHQREMKDLKAAGLNPLLTGKYGGSGTPPGTSITPENPLKGAVESTIAGLTSRENLKSMQQARSLNSALEMKAMEESTLLNEKWQTEQQNRKTIILQQAEQKANSEMWKKMGQGGKMGQLLGPLLKILGPLLLKK